MHDSSLLQQLLDDLQQEIYWSQGIQSIAAASSFSSYAHPSSLSKSPCIEEQIAQCSSQQQTALHSPSTTRDGTCLCGQHSKTQLFGMSPHHL